MYQQTPIVDCMQELKYVDTLTGSRLTNYHTWFWTEWLLLDFQQICYNFKSVITIWFTNDVFSKIFLQLAVTVQRALFTENETDALFWFS